MLLTPTISCIVPAFNSAAYLREALESILAQTVTPLEIVVADDGSTDGTPELARSLGTRVVEQDDRGPAATRNLGLGAARGELVAFLDADDRWHPRKLELQLEHLSSTPGLKVSLTLARLFWSGGLEAEEDRYKDHPRNSVPGYATTTMLAPRSVFDEVGTFNESLWFTDATDWFVRARELAVPMEVLQQELTFHRMHRDNLTRRRSEASRREFLRIVKGSLDRRRR